LSGTRDTNIDKAVVLGGSMAGLLAVRARLRVLRGSLASGRRPSLALIAPSSATAHGE
jgi:hypothetical protein